MIQTKLIAIILSALAVLGLSGGLYYKAYNAGYNKASIECATARKVFEDSMNNKIDAIESNLVTLAESRDAQTKQLSADIDKILINMKKAPVTIIKDGKCIPSPTFVDSIRQAINRANSK